MGYTRYWERTDKPITQEFVDEVKRIIEDATQKGITICGWDGTGEPTVTLTEISFNGKAPHMDCETMFISNDETEIGYGFCKTARMPYDYVVKRVLIEAEKEGLVIYVHSDGVNEMITDAEYMIF